MFKYFRKPRTFLEPKGVGSAGSPLRRAVSVGTAQVLTILTSGIKGVASILALPYGSTGIEVHIKALLGRTATTAT